MTSIEVRTMDAEQDILEGEKTYEQIAVDNGFGKIQGLHDHLLKIGRRDLLMKARLLPGGTPAKKAVAAARAVTKPIKPPLAEVLKDAGVKPDPAPPVPSPTSPPREEPVVAQQVQEEPKEGYRTANGATRHRDDHPISYGDMVWSYVEEARKSPKKATVRKAERAAELLVELIETVRAEADEVKALKEISDLEEKLAAAKAKLKAPAKVAISADPAVIRTWARRNGFELPDRGKMPQAVYVAYRDAVEAGTVDA